MSSAARSPEPPPAGAPDVLSGSVAVCVDRPVLALDRPFTYALPAELGAGVGSLVQVPFHGRSVRAWVLGATDDVPDRMLQVRRVVSPVRFFDARSLELLRWVSHRFVVPLATVIGRAVPPRVASEETLARPARAATATTAVGAPDRGALSRYRNGTALLEALERGHGSFVVRPGPRDEAMLAVACVRATLAGGRSAIVIVPEVDPLPATARAIVEAFGDEVARFYGGDRRERYRTWLAIARGAHRVVVGTHPAAFAPLPNVGLLYVHREGHALHREERSPRYHARDVAVARAELDGAVSVLSAFCPSLDASVDGRVVVEPNRRPWAPVEITKPGPEGRSPRLVRALREASGAFLFAPRRGYGVARVCRSCGEPAACAACLGMLRMQRGSVRCVVCEAPGRCASCGAGEFGIARGGAERVEEWARGLVRMPVEGTDGSPPGPGRVVVGGLDALKDRGAVELDLVGILDADLSLGRPGVTARERALVAWFEASAWARADGRVIVQTDRPNDPAVQALVAARPERFHRAEAPRLAEAGFPAGAAVFRVAGTEELERELETVRRHTLLSSSADGATICLIVLDPDDVPAFGEHVRRLAGRGVVTRVEAEPHLS